jgi:hypothetical protein
LVTGGTYQGDTGAPQMSSWPRFAPRLGGGLRNVRFSPSNASFRNIAGSLNLPVGYGGLPPILPPSTRLSDLATTPIAPPPPPLPPEIDRRDIPLPPPPEPRMPLSDQAWFERMNPGQTYRPPVSAAPIIAPPSPTGVSKSMDLGALISDLGSQYIQTRFAPTPAAPLFPAAVPAVAAGVGAAAASMGVGLPFVDVIPGAPDSSCGRGKPVYKYHCGEYKWVYPKRRRRKALATQSDLRGLAALKGVLGQGKAFEVWIATHS